MDAVSEQDRGASRCAQTVSCGLGTAIGLGAIAVAMIASTTILARTFGPPVSKSSDSVGDISTDFNYLVGNFSLLRQVVEAGIVSLASSGNLTAEAVNQIAGYIGLGTEAAAVVAEGVKEIGVSAEGVANSSSVASAALSSLSVSVANLTDLLAKGLTLQLP